MTRKYEPTSEAIERLTPKQRAVTQNDVTEPPFHNEFWDSKQVGIYVDVVSGEPLFASVNKFDSRTGWPSFTVPLEAGNVIERRDTTHGMVRTEVRSAHGDSHLGHLFPDGPPFVEVDDPWGWVRSLERARASPPPRHNFEGLVPIRSESPAYGAHHPELAAVDNEVGAGPEAVSPADQGEDVPPHRTNT